MLLSIDTCVPILIAPIKSSTPPLNSLVSQSPIS